MKKSTLTLALAISSTLALTACSIGGSDSPKDNVASLVKPTNANASTNPANIKDDAQEPLSGQYWEAHHKKDSSTYTLKNAEFGEDNVFELVIGNKTFDLVGVNELKYFGNEGTGIHTGGTTYSRFGIAWRDLAGDDDEDIAFYRGLQTLPKDMPTSGVAKYVGLAVHSCADACQDMSAKSSFDVDFGKKTITGVIEHADQKVNLGATISGSSFAGVANGVQTNGAFYGAQAEEMSGIYKDTKGKFFGAFGANQSK